MFAPGNNTENRRSRFTAGATRLSTSYRIWRKLNAVVARKCL